MKRLIFFICAFVVFTQNAYSQITAKVDERFELTSIAFAIAGAYEYNQCLIPSYKQDIYDEFEQYTSSRAISFIRELNQKHHIGYNAIPNTAVMLSITDGKIHLKPEYSLSDIPKRDSRWTEDMFRDYLEMLNEFYTESNFRRFYDNHRDLYNLAEEKIKELQKSISTEWFASFFGIPYDYSIDIYVSMANGPSNYAMSNNVLIGIHGDKNGLPDANIFVLQVLIHEIGHHYTNPLFKKWWPQLSDAAKVITPYVEDAMYKVGYAGEYTIFCEWLNNLFVFMYLKETNNSWLVNEIANYTNRGFIWMPRSVEFMNNFYDNRDKYVCIEDFMPQIVSFLNFTADNFDVVLREYEYRSPYIYSVYPAVGSDISEYNEIIVTFSEPMAKSWGFNGTGLDCDSIKELYISKIEWLDDCHLKISLDNSRMPDKGVYAIELNSSAFVSESEFEIQKGTRLSFNK